MPSKGTIVYWGGFELPDKNAAAHRVVANGKLFRELGYDVVYLGIAQERFSGVRKLSEGCYAEAHPESNVEWARHLVSLKNLRYVIAQCENVKVIILYNLPFVTLLRVKLSLRKYRVFYDCTEWTPDTEGSRLKCLFKRFDCFALRHWLPKLADGLIVISRLMEQAFKGHPHLLRLPPLIDCNATIWHQEPASHPGTFEFIYAGVLDNNKDRLDTIISAFHSLDVPEARLRVIGVTRESFIGYYPQFAGHPAMSDERILFMGRCTHEETVRYVLGCDCYIFVRPSDLRNNAGFPTKFVEAFTCGVPIIATAISDIKEYPAERVVVLPSVDEQSLTETMQAAVRKHYPRQPLSKAFHYASYRQAVHEWLEAALQ